MYEIGDKVKICTDLKLKTEMDLYKGMIATITGFCINGYTIDLDNGYCTWSDEMFETKYDYNYNIYTNNDKIVITDGKYTKEYNNYEEDSINIALYNFLKTKPWKPECGDKYYIVNDLNDIDFLVWKNTTYDNYRYKHGLACKTEKEATELRDCIKRAIKEFRGDL